MKSSVCLFLTLVLALPVARAQDSTHVETDIEFDAEVGLLKLEMEDGDTENYFSAVLMPTFTRGPWAGGLRIRARINNGGFRKEDYNSVADVLSIARFVQYRELPDTESPEADHYGRLGELEEVRFGYGQIIGEYRNTISADHPQIGLEGSTGTGDLYLQGMYSSITNPGIFGLRSAWWPFRRDAEHRLTDMIFGATLAGDLADVGRLVNPDAPGVPYIAEDQTGNPLIGLVPGESTGALLIASVDAGLPLHFDRLDELLVYTELAKILDFGTGLSLGLNGTKRKGGVLMEGWLEQRLIGKQYLPNYFNALYEIERVETTDVNLGVGVEIPAFQSKRNKLAGQDDTLIGSFAAFEAKMGRRYRFRTSYDRIWNKDASDWFHLDVRIQDPGLPYQVRFMFDRINMDEIEDIWNGPSENGIVRLELAYAFWEHILLGFRIRQSFEPVERLGRIVGQDKQTRIEPNVVVRL